MLTDDATSSVALPEVPLLAVLPGTGGLTRVTDKRRVRRDLADVFCSTEEGVKGQRAVDWGLVDEVVPNANFDAAVEKRAQALAEASDKPDGLEGIKLTPLERRFGDDGSVTYSSVEVTIDRDLGRATITIAGPEDDAPASTADLHRQGAGAWTLRAARELDDAILHLRLNEREIGIIAFRTRGDAEKVADHESFLLDNPEFWLASEIVHYWKRVLKRIDMTSRSLVALVEHGSCFSGMLAELIWASDRSYMMEGAFEGDNRTPATITITDGNFGPYPMGNGLTRLGNRFQDDDLVAGLEEHKDSPLEAGSAADLGLVTATLDDIDWEDEIRIFFEERASFSPDALTGMEANLRLAGPETMETRIFGRLTAWQNWIFIRPNAVGPDGALQRYGPGRRGDYNMERV
jgi:benzoyl-CoA-dihydrodiol lyase